MPKSTNSLNDWRAMQGMIRTGPSLTKALEREHAEELAREEKRLREFDKWDRQMAKDFSPGGRGHHLVKKVEQQIAAGEFTPMKPR